MSDQTAIEWCDSTFNPWIGCTKVSPACDHCYAERDMATRRGVVEWGAGKPRKRTSVANWKQPLRWNREAFYECPACSARFEGDPDGDFCPVCPRITAGKPARRRVFCASLADVFDNEVDPQWRADLFELIAATPNLDWLLLTKRVGNVAKMAAEACETIKLRGFAGHEYMRGKGYMRAVAWPLPNVWLGATVVNQAEADRDIPKLLAVPARVRFLSIEPMLGPVDLNDWWLRAPTHCERCDSSGPGGGREFTTCPWGACPHDTGVHRLDWVITGGESGPHARPMHPDWVRSLRDQCAAAETPFLFKQWGEWLPINQQEEAFTNSLYKPNRVAREGQDQGALDESYGRRCTVPHGVVHADGSFHSLQEPMAFLQGTGAMSTFRIGKRAAGRHLDGREHSEWPA